MKITKVGVRQAMGEAIELLENSYQPKGQLTSERQRVAANVHLNDEWQEYVKVSLENIRNSVLQDDGDTNIELKRGMILALVSARRFFKNQHISSQKDNS